MQKIEEIYNEHFNTVFKFLLCLSNNNIEVAEDLTQETFYKAIKSIDHFSEQCKISVWLCQIAKHLYYDYYKKAKKHKKIEETENIDSILNEAIEEEFIINIEKSILHKRIQQLDEPIKQVIYLRILGNLTFKEISIILNKSEVWARVNYYRGKEKLKED